LGSGRPGTRVGAPKQPLRKREEMLAGEMTPSQTKRF